MDQPGSKRVSRPVSGDRYLRRLLEQRAAEAKEDVARWKRDFPGREPGTSTRTWKSYSRQRLTSKKFRENYLLVDWRPE